MYYDGIQDATRQSLSSQGQGSVTLEDAIGLSSPHVSAMNPQKNRETL